MTKVFTYGVFDLLHIGHLKSLQECKYLGDHLTVGVFTDKVAKSFKRLPIIPEHQRLEMIRGLKCVDSVFLLDIIIPDVTGFDIIAKGTGAGYENIIFPIKKILLDYHSDTSTTEIIEKCQKYLAG
jgi:cytidyltransferase-like protein